MPFFYNNHSVCKIHIEKLLNHRKCLCITHHFEENVCYCVIINHSDEVQQIGMQIAEGFHLGKIYKGKCDAVAPFESVILKFQKVK